jgi:4-diphosphocytidyl-2-C-methyl-D-erythritol kinase
LRLAISAESASQPTAIPEPPATPVAGRLAPAKINLALHVLGRRADGYHELDTLAVFADIGDRLDITPAAELSLSIAGPRASDAPGGRDNLVLRGAEALQQAAGVSSGAAIQLWKTVPAGAGFGGGSADAAAVLAALNALWELGLSPTDLRRIARPLGADVPMCLEGRALQARGIGEQIEPVVGWPTLPLVLIWPGRPASTAAVFAALERKERGALSPPPSSAGLAQVVEWLSAQRNDLEAPAQGIVPDIAEALEVLRRSSGCLLARMSGSGSGCFGVFAERHAAESAAAEIALARPRWWIAATAAR